MLARRSRHGVLTLQPIVEGRCVQEASLGALHDGISNLIRPEDGLTEDILEVAGWLSGAASSFALLTIVGSRVFATAAFAIPLPLTVLTFAIRGSGSSACIACSRGLSRLVPVISAFTLWLLGLILVGRKCLTFHFLFHTLLVLAVVFHCRPIQILL